MLEFKYNGNLVRMEHSLVAISKFESFFKKPFLNQKLEVTEKLAYFDHMVVDDVKHDWRNLTEEYVMLIQNYINEERTATVIHSDGESSNMTMTSEVLYAYMSIAGVDISCETWHISRLLTLLNVLAVLKSEKKPMSQQDIYEQQRTLNEQRRAQLNSKG